MGTKSAVILILSASVSTALVFFSAVAFGLMVFGG